MLHHKIIRYYANIYFKSPIKFLMIWTIFAIFPLLSSVLFDRLVLYILDRYNFLFIILNLVSIIVAFVLLIFLVLTIWAAFSNRINIREKFLIILYAYVLIWFAYGNLYYFSCDIDNYNSVLTVSKDYKYLDKENFRKKIKEMQYQTPIKGINNFWELDDDLKPQTANRLKSLIDCYYFSGVTMLTIGFGDVTPTSSLLRIFSVFQGFLGQVIVVIAMGIWINKATR